MLIRLTVYSIVTLLLFLPVATADSGEKKHDFHLKPISEQFLSLGRLVGTWEGKKKDHDGNLQDVIVKYRLTAGGSALVEELFPGTAEEMISVYHDDGDSVLMTHYCGFGNQPRMRSTKDSKKDKVSFKFVDGGNMNSPADPHMGALTISFLGKDKIAHEWSMFKDGKVGRKEPFELTRVQ